MFILMGRDTLQSEIKSLILPVLFGQNVVDWCQKELIARPHPEHARRKPGWTLVCWSTETEHPHKPGWAIIDVTDDLNLWRLEWSLSEPPQAYIDRRDELLRNVARAREQLQGRLDEQYPNSGITLPSFELATPLVVDLPAPSVWPETAPETPSPCPETSDASSGGYEADSCPSVDAGGGEFSGGGATGSFDP